MNYPHQIDGDNCDDTPFEGVLVGQYDCGNGCIRLWQDDDMIDLTPHMVAQLIAALQEVSAS